MCLNNFSTFWVWLQIKKTENYWFRCFLSVSRTTQIHLTKWVFELWKFSLGSAYSWGIISPLVFKDYICSYVTLYRLPVLRYTVLCDYTCVHFHRSISCEHCYIDWISPEGYVWKIVLLSKSACTCPVAKWNITVTGGLYSLARFQPTGNNGFLLHECTSAKHALSPPLCSWGREVSISSLKLTTVLHWLQI